MATGNASRAMRDCHVMQRHAWGVRRMPRDGVLRDRNRSCLPTSTAAVQCQDAMKDCS
ncbi:hypothetical protein [Paracidovorax cattleyae]|uniref:hypothetical protein n=1 Tax=Paracidovorax cattleyae TaxID=80868 RepID=UPI00142897CD|nr:hypothetical protein [Paracidovorax cattleyae]